MSRYVPALTPRQKQVLDLLAEGLQHWQIGERLGITTSTVKTHVIRIFETLGASNAAHAVHLAHRAGLLGGGS